MSRDSASSTSDTSAGRIVRSLQTLGVAAAILITIVAACRSSSAAAVTRAPVIAAAGDIACGPSEIGSSGNNINLCQATATSDLLVGGHFAKVLALGDEQYPCGSLADFEKVYNASWGRVKALTRPVPGNHEYGSIGTGCAAAGNADGYYQYFGREAGSPQRGYYSFDVGAWHLIALNSDCTAVGCAKGSPQERWLKRDLVRHRRKCTLAFWHHPRFSSGPNGNEPETDAFWRDLYAARADVVLVGHDHDYERFAPQSPNGHRDSRGIREFVVGTGGKSHFAFLTTQPNSEARNADTFGILELTLQPVSYSWKFVPIAGGTFKDSGSAACH